MPTDQYQTPPEPSLLDPNTRLSELAVQLDPESIKDLDLEGLLAFQRAANYLAAAQIFLQSNTLLQRPITHDDVKPRLLGASSQHIEIGGAVVLITRLTCMCMQATGEPAPVSVLSTHMRATLSLATLSRATMYAFSTSLARDTERLVSSRRSTLK